MRSAASRAERVYVVGDSGSFPGPDWMPKQAHMADLQAAAAAENLLADLQGASRQRHLQGRADLHRRRHRPRHADLAHARAQLAAAAHPAVPLGQARLRVELPAPSTADW
jgi:NADH dehydrogenase FAD-containing subunit